MRIEDKLNKLKIKFKKITLQDKKLKKYYEGKNVKYESIVVASAIVGGIDLRNCINNTCEKYPYNRKELKIIDKFHKLEKKFLEV